MKIEFPNGGGWIGTIEEDGKVFAAMVARSGGPRRTQLSRTTLTAWINELTAMRDTMPIELLPCPFCGSKAAIPPQSISNEKAVQLWEVQCSSDTCQSRTGMYSQRNLSVAAWNRRPKVQP